MNTDILARNLRLIMGYRNIWNCELAALTGISLYEVNCAMTGRGHITENAIKKFASVLKVEESILFDPNAIIINFE